MEILLKKVKNSKHNDSVSAAHKFEQIIST